MNDTMSYDFLIHVKGNTLVFCVRECVQQRVSVSFSDCYRARACIYIYLCISGACICHMLRVFVSLLSMCVSARFVIYV